MLGDNTNWTRHWATRGDFEDGHSLSGRLDQATSRSPFQHELFCDFYEKQKSRHTARHPTVALEANFLLHFSWDHQPASVELEKKTHRCVVKTEACTEGMLLPAGGGMSWSRQPALPFSSESHSFPVHPTEQKEHPCRSTLHIFLNHRAAYPASILIFLLVA